MCVLVEGIYSCSRNSLSLFYLLKSPFSLSLSLSLSHTHTPFDSTLKPPSSISFYPYIGDFPRMRHRICRRYRTTSTFRYDYAQAKPLTDVAAHRFWISRLSVRVLPRINCASSESGIKEPIGSNSGFVSCSSRHILYLAIVTDKSSYR